MAMKKIKPQYGKVVPPAVTVPEENADSESPQDESALLQTTVKKQTKPKAKAAAVTPAEAEEKSAQETAGSISALTAQPNPFLQSKDVFSQANLTKIGYRMRTEYVEILDVLKKLKKGGYTLEAVLDDALTYYFENSEDGKDAIRKAEIFYS